VYEDSILLATGLYALVLLIMSRAGREMAKGSA
jgi:hypothetical protein